MTSQRFVLIGALLAEQNEVWLERDCLDMGQFNEDADARNAAIHDETVVAITH